MNTAAADIQAALDPCALMQAAGLAPDEWQKSVLRGGWHRLLMLCSRQAGKSTVASCLAAHQALYTPDSLTLIAAPSQRQAKETLAKVWTFYRTMGQPAEVVVKSELRFRLENGSRVLALPGTEKSVRGFSAPSLVVIDEAARVDDDLYEALRPMLAVGEGRVAALSTPWGRRGWFHNAWSDPMQEWERVKVTAEEVPRISEDFLRGERRELGPWLFEQEYQCRFVDAISSVFRTEDIDRAFTGEVLPVYPSAMPTVDANGSQIDALDL